MVMGKSDESGYGDGKEKDKQMKALCGEVVSVVGIKKVKCKSRWDGKVNKRELIKSNRRVKQGEDFI